MEPSEEEDAQEIAENLFVLKQSARVAEDSITQALNRLKVAQHKLKLEVEELSETELRSKPALREWLKARNLALDCSFQEFFQNFLVEHKNEFRLDLTDRSILLNQDGCKLFGIPGKNIKMRVPDILQRLPLLYH